MSQSANFLALIIVAIDLVGIKEIILFIAQNTHNPFVLLCSTFKFKLCDTSIVFGPPVGATYNGAEIYSQSLEHCTSVYSSVPTLELRWKLSEQYKSNLSCTMYYQKIDA